MNAESAGRLVRAWVRLYTRGLPADVRVARTDEIESDLWSQHDEARSADRNVTGVATEIVTRLALGIPADVAWRLEQGRLAAPRIERHRDPGTRTVALLAVIGGLAWAAAIADWAITGLDHADSGWDQPAIEFAGMVGVLAISLSLGGLGFILTNRFDSTVGLLGLLGGAGGAMGLLGAYAAILLLPVGSVAVVLFLARIHATGWATTLIHTAAAPALFLGLAAYSNETLVGAASVFMLAYAFTWVAVGLALFGGLPQVRSSARAMR